MWEENDYQLHRKKYLHKRGAAGGREDIQSGRRVNLPCPRHCAMVRVASNAKGVGKTHHKRGRRARHESRPLETIVADLTPEGRRKLAAREVDEDLPSGGRYYCIECARYFLDTQGRY